LTRAVEWATLVKALATVAPLDRRGRARRFLQGLSTDELRYIASYVGACLIECALQPQPATRCQLAREIEEYECCRMTQAGLPSDFAKAAGAELLADVEHKMILLLEYLSSCGCAGAIRVTAGSA